MSLKPSNLILLSVLSFISGAMLAVFLFMQYTGPVERKHSPSNVEPEPPASTYVQIPPPQPNDLKTEIQPHSLIPKAPETSNLMPNKNETAQIIDLLRSGFLDSASLISVNLNEQSLNSVMTTLSGKVKLSEEAVITPNPKQASLLTTLPNGIAYWRPTELSKREIDKFIEQTNRWKTQHCDGLVLDLRYFKDANNLNGAVSAAGLFLPPQTVLFSVEGLNTPEQLYKTEHQPIGFQNSFPLIVLINQQTRGTGEALAWSLRHFGGALLVGQPTAGEGGLFTESRLKSGRFLRMASARLRMPGDRDLLGTPVLPDIMVPVETAADHQAFYAAYSYDLEKLVAEKPSNPRNNDESILGTDIPNGDSPSSNIRDIILQRAGDVIRGITLSRRRPEINNG